MREFAVDAGADGAAAWRELRFWRAEQTALSALAVSPDNAKIATASTGIKIWSRPDGALLERFSGHPTLVRLLAFGE